MNIMDRYIHYISSISTRKYLLNFKLMICQFLKPKPFFAISELSPNVFLHKNSKILNMPLGDEIIRKDNCYGKNTQSRKDLKFTYNPTPKYS